MLRFLKIIFSLTLLAFTGFAEAHEMEEDGAVLPYPVYVAQRLSRAPIIDGTLNDPVWRETSPGWGLSHDLEPNVYCPDVTLFRIGYDADNLYLSLAAYKRSIEAATLPAHIWKPRETDIMDMQSVPRYDRMRGVTPPVNTADVLINLGPRTLTFHFDPETESKLSVHDALGERKLDVIYDLALQKDLPAQWTAELAISWENAGFPLPKDGDNLGLQVYRDIRFMSNWAFIAWMRLWSKQEEMNFKMEERFGRILFYSSIPDATALETVLSPIVKDRGPTRVFLPKEFWIAKGEGRIVKTPYAERVVVMKTYLEELNRDVKRYGNDLPYFPFYTEKEPKPEVRAARGTGGRINKDISEPPAWDDPASTVARISAAIPEMRAAIAVLREERLYRGLPE